MIETFFGEIIIISYVVLCMHFIVKPPTGGAFCVQTTNTYFGHGCGFGLLIHTVGPRFQSCSFANNVNMWTVAYLSVSPLLSGN